MPRRYHTYLISCGVVCLSEQVWASPGSGCVCITTPHRPGGDSSLCFINTLRCCDTNTDRIKERRMMVVECRLLPFSPFLLPSFWNQSFHLFTYLKKQLSHLVENGLSYKNFALNVIINTIFNKPGWMNHFHCGRDQRSNHLLLYGALCWNTITPLQALFTWWHNGLKIPSEICCLSSWYQGGYLTVTFTQTLRL